MGGEGKGGVFVVRNTMMVCVLVVCDGHSAEGWEGMRSWGGGDNASNGMKTAESNKTKTKTTRPNVF